MKNTKKLFAVALAALMLVAMAAPAFAYQSALNSSCTPFTDVATAKMAAMKDGDNIFAIGEYDKTTYTSAKAYGESGNCQFVYQHSDGKWGRAIKGASWSINGMQNVGDGIIDCPLAGSPAGGLFFCRSTEHTGLIDANAQLETGGKYFTLCGWEFAADFKVKGFKAIFNKAAVADDFDILVGHLENDEIVWEVAYEAKDVAASMTAVAGTTNEMVAFAADFDKTFEGRFVQFAPTSTDGMDTTVKNGQSGYVLAEFEMYYGEVAPAAPSSVINSAEDFAAMAPDGSYELGADITVAATYEAAFTGSFDGKGHTITTSVPLFKEVGGGSFKNLTIVGEITLTGSSTYGAALALRVTKNTTTTFENITNKAKVTGEYRTGGIVAQINCSASKEATTTTTFKSCVNEGDITGANMVGGLVGYSQGAHDTFIDCTNKGNVTAISGLAGGIIGRSAGDLGGSADTKNDGPMTYSIDFTNCVNDGAVVGLSNVGGIIGYAKSTTATFTGCTNNGAVTSGNETTKGSDAGGILGHGGASNYFAHVIVRNCVNNGKITYFTTDEAGNGAGGIVGYVYGSGEYGVGDVQDCQNHGELVSGSFAGQFISYTNNNLTVIKNCLGDGKITAKYPVIVGLSSADAMLYTIVDVQIAKDSGETLFSWATSADNAKNQIQLADYMNLFPGNVYYIGEKPVVTDAPTEAPTQPQDQPTEAPTQPQDQPTEAPTQPQDQPTEAPTEAPTQAPEQPTEAPKDDKGCGSVVACGLALVAVLGTAYVAKRKF